MRKEIQVQRSCKVINNYLSHMTISLKNCANIHEHGIAKGLSGVKLESKIFRSLD